MLDATGRDEVESPIVALHQPIALGGDITLWRAIVGKWRAEADETENYAYAIAL